MHNKINFIKALGIIAILTIIGAAVLVHDTILNMINGVKK